jgi:hypothetical protein
MAYKIRIKKRELQEVLGEQQESFYEGTVSKTRGRKHEADMLR